MLKPFIKNHQRNVIRSQLSLLVQTVYFVGDWRVYEATKIAVKQRILEMFPGMTAEQQALFEPITSIRGQAELNAYVESLGQYVISFPTISANELRKLFPKVKKLVLPDLEQLPFERMSYLGWRDVGSNSLYLVYPRDGKMHALACRYVSGPRSSICTLCGSVNEVGLVTTVAKSSNYQSYGNHLCLNSEVCNSQITSLDRLESFVLKAFQREA